jgi:hypothetical protein
MNPEEKRIYPRAEVNWPISATTSGGTVQGETKNLSTHGAFIYCSKPLSPNERFLLTVDGPSSSMQVIAQVVWSNSCACTGEKSANGMGVKFIWHWPEILMGWMERSKTSLRLQLHC